MGETREHIIDLADSLIRKRGFNAFSYSDIATILDIRNAACITISRPSRIWARQ